MSVMQAPHPAPANERQSSAADPDWIADLEAIHDTLDLGAGHRIEILEGQLKVSPGPVGWHSLAVKWLMRELDEVCTRNNWADLMGICFELPPTRERIEADLTIHHDQSKVDLRSVYPAREALLVAEVVSQSSIRDDREVKPRSCALAGVPLYLLVDRFVAPMTVTVFSEPGKQGYAKFEAVPFGGKLHIPQPFELMLDTGTLPLPK